MTEATYDTEHVFHANKDNDDREDLPEEEHEAYEQVSGANNAPWYHCDPKANKGAYTQASHRTNDDFD